MPSLGRTSLIVNFENRLFSLGHDIDLFSQRVWQSYAYDKWERSYVRRQGSMCPKEPLTRFKRTLSSSKSFSFCSLTEYNLRIGEEPASDESSTTICVFLSTSDVHFEGIPLSVYPEWYTRKLDLSILGRAFLESFSVFSDQRVQSKCVASVVSLPLLWQGGRASGSVSSGLC